MQAMGGVSSVGDCSCDSGWSEASRHSLQTLNRELRAVCPLSRISTNRREETIASIHQRTIQKIHGLKTRTGKFATEYYMKSIDRECVCCRKLQVVEQKLQESNVKRRCITEHNGLTLFASMYCKLLISSNVSNNMATLPLGKQISELL